MTKNKDHIADASKMACPFCGADLIQVESTVSKLWRCSNLDCKGHDYFGNEDFWQTIMDGKDAQDMVKSIKKRLDSSFKSENDGWTTNWRRVAEMIRDDIFGSVKGKTYSPKTHNMHIDIDPMGQWMEQVGKECK